MKRLFFAALVAVAAIGSANAIDVSTSANTPKTGECLSTGTPSCLAATYYEPQTENIISSDVLVNTFYNPL